MAALDRDAILEALLARLQAELAGDVKTFTRRLETYANTELLPALVVLSPSHTAQTDLGMPPIWRMNVEVDVYLETLAADVSPETRLNAIVKKLEEALERKATEARPAFGGDERGTTLGGICSSCNVTRVEVSQGTENGQGEAVVSITITAPAP